MSLRPFARPASNAAMNRMMAAAASGRLAAKKIRNPTKSQIRIFLTTSGPPFSVDTHRNSENHFFGVLLTKRR